MMLAIIARKFSICSSLWWCAWGAEDIFEVLYKGRSGVLHKCRNGILPETLLPAKKKNENHALFNLASTHLSAR